MKMQPLISIILPAYNASKYLDDAIRSVLNQTYQNWELIVINDGSTDDTEAVVCQYQDPRIQYYKQVNKGVSSARNKGLQIMLGEFFCFLDADDVLPLRSLESRLAKFIEDPTLEFVDGIVQVLDESLTRNIRTFRPRFSGNPLPLLLSLSDKCFFGPSWMIKRNEHVYKMDEALSHGEDYFFYLTLSRKNGSYDFVNEEVLYYRKRQHSAMENLHGLHNGYKRIYAQLLGWPEFLISHRMAYSYKMRKIIFLSYMSVKKFKTAFSALFT